MKKIEIDVQCPACGGSGVYCGFAEGKGTAVVCNRCNGSGKYHYVYEYEEFSGRKIKEGIKRVYLSGYGYMTNLGKIKYDGVGLVDMNKEGVSYEEFLNGKMPSHTEIFGCPMIADQGACHNVPGFTEECTKLNGGGYIGYIRNCKYQDKKHECWKRFKKYKG